MTDNSKRGGARPGAGRKGAGEVPMVPWTGKLLPEQREKLLRLGGATWLRKKIDRAKEPK
jgi:hypothetical protein